MDNSNHAPRLKSIVTGQVPQQASSRASSSHSSRATSSQPSSDSWTLPEEYTTRNTSPVKSLFW